MAIKWRMTLVAPKEWMADHYVFDNGQLTSVISADSTPTIEIEEGDHSFVIVEPLPQPVKDQPSATVPASVLHACGVRGNIDFRGTYRPPTLSSSLSLRMWEPSGATLRFRYWREGCKRQTSKTPDI